MTETAEILAIARPAADVWAALAEFGEIARWAPNVDHSCLMSEQTEGVGMVRRIQAGRTTVLEQVVEWDPGRCLAYTIEGLPPMVRSARNAWTLDEADGSTMVTLTTTIDAGPRPPQKLVARVVGRVLAKASDQMLHGLDDHLHGVVA